MKSLVLPTVLGLMACTTSGAAAPEVVALWPERPPGEARELPPERDTTTPDSRNVAGRRVMRIGNVSTPTLTLHRPDKGRDHGTSVIICPGGGHHILAWDLEGTEVAAWLNSLGITACLLKYRVPAPEQKPRWRAAVQDAQRAVSLVRARSQEWELDPDRIGILGFSAGGETAALTSLFTQRTYAPVDEADQRPHVPDFMILVYAAGIVDRESLRIQDHVVVTPQTPPAFLAHAYDDKVPVENSVKLFLELKRQNVPAELHVYAAGGHGYGLRETQEPVTTWHHRCADWLKASGWLRAPDHP